mgnify:FL=1
MHMTIIYALFCKQIRACKPLNAMCKEDQILLPPQSNDVMLRITSLLLTVDFAVSLLDNHILSPLLMVMSLAVTADTDMMTVVF